MEYNTEHYLERLQNRVFKALEKPVHKKDRLFIKSSLDSLNELDIHNMKSTAICLHKFDIKRRSPWMVFVGKRKYYRIYDIMGVDSTGDELWIVVRNGKIKTVMLRKEIQPLEKLRVEKIIDLSYKK